MSFSIYAYRVEPITDAASPLENLLTQYHALPIEQRMRTIGVDQFRLEDLENRDGLLLLDFVRIRHEHGPGRAHPHEHVTGFEFEPGEAFGEETAALYDPGTRSLILQFNFSGVRSGHLQQYLSSLNNNPDDEYDLVPRFDENVETRLRHKRIIRKLSFKMPVTGIQRADRNAGVPLTRVLGISQQYGAESLKITLSAGRRRGHSLDLGRFNQALSWLNSRLGIDDNSVTSITVTGKDNIDEETEVLNLLGHRLRISFNDLTVGEDLRIPQEERWNAIIRAYNGWRAQLRH